MKIALALIVKGTDEEALLLNKCLESLAPYVDGIFITRTHLKDETPNAAVGNVAINYGAVVSDFEWVDDFAAARNHSFQQVPATFDWIMWSDADDVWRGMEKLRPTLEKNKHVDAFGMWYLYDWDDHKKPTVVHRKTMIIKNDGCAEWVGSIHEDLQPKRTMETYLIDGIDRLHLTTMKRAGENAERNLRIAKKEVKEKDEDPRSYWNLANSQFGVSDFNGARETFEAFIKTSQSTEEVYLARTRLANVYKSLSKREECIRELQTAIGLYPSLPDAYLQLASYYYEFENFDKAEEYCLQGMVKRPQIMKMVVYNPRDYDYNPMMLLAKIYYHKHRSDLMLPLLKGCLRIYPNDQSLKDYVKDAEKDKDMLEKALITVQKLQKIKDTDKLRVELEKLPEELRSHPHIVQLRNQHFVKQTSTGKDLVIYCGNTVHTWNPDLFKTQGFGGSEEAVIHMARELSKIGWNVTVYNNCGHKPVYEPFNIQLESGITTGRVITYLPFWEFNYRDKQDVVILWRWAKPLDAEINAPKIFLDLHDVIPEGELTEKRLNKVSKIFVKSQFHRSLFPNTPDEKFAIVPNGLEIYKDDSIKKDPYLIINTSSPDRSMDVLPKLFTEVKKRIPQARLQWCYGWEGFISAHQGDQKKMQWMEDTKKAIQEAGIEDLGRITQEEVGKLYQKASIFAYPTEFAEIDCISVKKAQVAGAYPVTTDFAALAESNVIGSKVHSEKTKDNWNRPYAFHFGLEGEKEQAEWVDEVVRNLFAHEVKGTFPNWAQTAERWNNELI